MNDSVVLGKGLQEEALKAAERLKTSGARTAELGFSYGGATYTLSKAPLTELGYSYITSFENGETYYLYRGSGPV